MGNGRKWAEMSGNGRKYLQRGVLVPFPEMGGNGRKWAEMGGNGRKWDWDTSVDAQCKGKHLCFPEPSSNCLARLLLVGFFLAF